MPLRLESESQRKHFFHCPLCLSLCPPINRPSLTSPPPPPRPRAAMAFWAPAPWWTGAAFAADENPPAER